MPPLTGSEAPRGTPSPRALPPNTDRALRTESGQLAVRQAGEAVDDDLEGHDGKEGFLARGRLAV